MGRDYLTELEQAKTESARLEIAYDLLQSVALHIEGYTKAAGDKVASRIWRLDEIDRRLVDDYHSSLDAFRIIRNLQYKVMIQRNEIDVSNGRARNH